MKKTANVSVMRFVLTVCVLGMVVATGCQKQSAPAQSKKKVIGFSVVDMQPMFFQEMERGTRDACKELGYDYKLHDQKYDPALLVSGCENLLTSGVDALIISPNEPSAMGPVVKKAKMKGIPVIIDDIGGGGADYDAIVASDCYGGGAAAADYMDKILSKRTGAPKEVGVIKCMPGHVYPIRRGEGFTDRIQKLGYKVVSTLCANDVRDQGYRVAQDMMTAHPGIAGIFCENDPMALGAVQAVRDAKKSAIDDVLVVGFNADPEAVDAIKAGNMAATVRQSPYEMGRKCVELVDRCLKKQPLTFTDPKLREITVPVKVITLDDLKK